MKTQILSDHTADQLQATREQRRIQVESALENYLISIRARFDTLGRWRERAAQAWATRSIGLWIQAWAQWFVLRFSPMPTNPYAELSPQADSQRIQAAVWSAGQEGEQKVQRYLAQHLPDSYTLVCGYRNGGGEIDQILVGPHALVALEIKYVNGTVHCDGDYWWRDKYDKYGNPVQRGVVIADKHGRSPSTQINDACTLLQAPLSKQLDIHPLHRAVVLCHSSSQLGQLQRQTVDCIATLHTARLLNWLRDIEDISQTIDTEQVLACITQDHQIWDRKLNAKPLPARKRSVQRTQV